MSKVLIIEDDAILQMVLSDMLATLHCTTEVAGTGATALDLIKQNTYDIAFLDLGLPDIEGPELAKTLRTQGFKFPIIACTGRTASEAEQKCLNAGITGFLTKPVDIATLKETLEKYLNQAA